jgi:hypothetical protein
LGVALHGRCASPVAGRSSPPPSPMQQHALAWQRKGSAQLAVTDRARPGARLDGPCRARVRAWSMRTHRCDRRGLLRGRLVIAQTSPEANGGTGSSRAPLLRFRTLTSELVRASCPGRACREGEGKGDRRRRAVCRPARRRFEFQRVLAGKAWPRVQRQGAMRSRQ